MVKKQDTNLYINLNVKISEAHKGKRSLEIFARFCSILGKITKKETHTHTHMSRLF